METIKLNPTNRISTFFFVLAFAIFSLTSCQQTDDEILDAIAEDEIQLAETEESVEASYEDVEEFSIEAMELTDNSADARLFSDPSALQIPACATVTHDSVNKIITIDFGTGCVGPDGKLRSGKVIISYTVKLYKPGASLTVTLDNYYVDGKHIEGTKTIKNVSPNLQSDISLKTTLVGGKVTWPDSTFATRQFTRTKTWVRASNPINDEFHLEGTIKGTRKNGNAYSCNIISTLIIKRKCRKVGVKIPVQGLKVIKRTGKPNLLLDFGDGDCDNLITVTKNGSSKVIDVTNL